MPGIALSLFVRGSRTGDANVMLETLGESQAPASKDVVDELVKSAIPLETVDAGHGFEDMRPLKEIVGGARIVSLGDAAPGTRELFQMKQRVFEFLVTEMGFSVLAIEANWPESLALNEYVLHGTGDPKALLAELHSMSWNTVEALDLIQWIRKWNADEKHAQKIQLLGFDMQYTRVAYQKVQEYLQKVDEESGERMGIVLAAFRQVDNQGRPRYASLEPEMKGAAHAAIQEALSLLEDSKEIYIKKSSAAEWAIAKQSTVILAQAEEMMGAESSAESAAAREHAMAENIAWILGQEPLPARMVVWAHNAHVRDEVSAQDGHGRDEKEPLYRRMGSRLREKFGKDDVIFGFAFNQGSFLVQDGSTREKGSKGPPEVRVGPAPEETVEAALARTKLSLAVFALARLPKDGAAVKWMDASQMMRETDAVVTGERDVLVRVTPARAYDALVFVEHTTSARPIPKIEPKDK
jgi:erythromycin esterase